MKFIKDLYGTYFNLNNIIYFDVAGNKIYANSNESAYPIHECVEEVDAQEWLDNFMSHLDEFAYPKEKNDPNV